MIAPAKPCDVASCDQFARSSTAHYCNAHRLRVAKYGTPELPAPKSITERFWSRVAKSSEDECWEWTGAHGENGYGRILTAGRGSRYELAHRLSYRIHHGSIDSDLTIDHLCCNKGCVNPAHLEQVTREENIRRAKRRWTHCIHGHEFNAENTYWRKEGRRGCRQCARDRRAAS